MSIYFVLEAATYKDKNGFEFKKWSVSVEAAPR